MTDQYTVADVVFTFLRFCSKSSGSAAFIGLSWTCMLVSNVFSAPEKREGALWKKMVSRGASVLFDDENMKYMCSVSALF